MELGGILSGLRRVNTRLTSATPRGVVAVAATASLALTGIAGVGVASSHREVIVEVDGVSRPVQVWGTRVADALRASGLELSSHDLVSPAMDRAVRAGDTVVVRRAHAHELVIDGVRRTVWSTSSSADAILADAAAASTQVMMAADRSSSRAVLPLVSRPRTVLLRDGAASSRVRLAPGQDVRQALAAAGISLTPNDRVRVASVDGALQILVQRVTRGEVTTESVTPVEERREESADMFEGESKVVDTGAEARVQRREWRETVEGEVIHSALLEERVLSEAKPRIVRIGTKKATPEALAAAGIDPKAKLEERTEADGTVSLLYRARLGSLSSPSEAAAAGGASAPNVPLVYSGDDPRTVAKQMVAARGWGDGEFQCLVALWNRESHWNPYAENPYSGAYGIPQALPGTKMASAGADWRTNPVTQITWGLGYIAGRYGTPCGAWQHSEAIGWY